MSHEINDDLLTITITKDTDLEDFAAQVTKAMKAGTSQAGMEALKQGARHSRTDHEMLQTIHDHALKLGASCGSEEKSVAVEAPEVPEPPETPAAKSIDLEDVLVTYGGEIKALGDGKVGGYLVRFGSEDDTDLEGDYFTKDTDFGFDDTGQSRVYYNHGLNKTLGKRRITRGDLRLDDVGVWIEAELDLADKYQAAIMDRMVKANKAGWSSGTAAHLVEREPAGKAYWVKSWPLGLDASITPTPAEPRNRAVPLKSLVIDTDELELEAAPEASHDAAPAAESKAVILPTEPNTEDIMTDEIKAMLQQIIDKQNKVDELAAEVKGIKEKLEAEPPIKAVGTALPEETKSVLDPLSGKNEMPFKSFGEQLQAVYKAAVDPAHPNPKLFEVKAPLGASEGTPSEGGWLVQAQFSDPLWEKTYEVGQLMQRVNRQPIGAGFNRLVYNQIDENSRANGSRWGGIQMYWASEAGSVTATKPKFKQVSLALEKLFGVCYATDELIADTTALEAYVNRTFPKEAAFKTELAIVRGGGAGTPLGILASPALIEVPKETGQAAATIVSQNVMKMWSRMWAPSRLNAVWLVSQDAEPQLWSMTQTVGTGGVPIFSPPGGLSQSPYATLYNRPILANEYTSVLGTVGDIILWDPSEYMLVDKGGVQSASSIHVGFLTDEMTYRFTFRVNGHPQWSAALTPYSGGPTVSPMVALATRA